MSKKVVSIELFNQNNAQVIKQAIDDLKAYSLDSKIDTFIQRLATEGSEVAQRFYGPAVKVEIRPDNTEDTIRYWIEAKGRAVCFLEFGAGVTTAKNHPLRLNMPFKVEPGSWSITHARQFSTFGYWIFGQTKLDHVNPRFAMYNATLEIQRKALQIAKEVFQ